MSRQNLIKAGVRNLQEFGYTSVNEKNILTDEMFKKFFVSMLRDNMGFRSDIDKTINSLLKELEA